MSNGMASASPVRSSGATSCPANRAIGVGRRRAPSTRARRQTASIRAAASASAPGGAPRSRSAPSAGARRRPAPRARRRSTGGRAVRRVAGPSDAQSSVSAETVEVDGVGVEHGQDLGAGARRHPQHHLADAEPGEVLELRRRSGPCRTGPPGRWSGSRPGVLDRPAGARAWRRPGPIPRRASTRRRTRRRRRSCRRGGPRRAAPATRRSGPAWASSSTGSRSTNSPWNSAWSSRPQGLHAQHVLPGDPPAGRRSRPRGRRPPRGSIRSRCRGPPGRRSGGRGWPPAWPARSGRAGRPAPPRSRVQGRRSPTPRWPGPRRGRGSACSRRPGPPRPAPAACRPAPAGGCARAGTASGSRAPRRPRARSAGARSRSVRKQVMPRRTGDQSPSPAASCAPGLADGSANSAAKAASSRGRASATAVPPAGQHQPLDLAGGVRRERGDRSGPAPTSRPAPSRRGRRAAPVRRPPPRSAVIHSEASSAADGPLPPHPGRQQHSCWPPRAGRPSRRTGPAAGRASSISTRSTWPSMENPSPMPTPFTAASSGLSNAHDHVEQVLEPDAGVRVRPRRWRWPPSPAGPGRR